MQVFFIVGAQKSGTTWLQKSLNSIDGIHCMGEGHFIDKLLMPVAQTRHEYNQMMEVVHQRAVVLMASPRRRVASGIIILDSSTTSSIFFTPYSSLVGSARKASTRPSSFLVSAS